MLKKLSYKLLFVFAFTAGFFFFAHGASAATYYVATTGSNGNPGTIGSPWATMTYAEATAATNDTIHVATGTYTEGLFLNLSKGITWIADGAVTVKSTGPTYVMRANGVTTASWDGFTFDGEASRSNAVFLNGASNKTFTNCTFTGATSIALNMSGSTNSVSGSTFTVTAGQAIRATAFTGVTINNNTFNVNGIRVIDTSSTGGTLSFTNNTVNATIGSVSNAVIEISSSGAYTIDGNNITVTGRVLNAVTGTGTIDFTNNDVTLTLVTTANYISFTSGAWAPDVLDNTITSLSATGAGHIISATNQASIMVGANTIDTASTGALEHITIDSTGTTVTGNIYSNTLRSRSLGGYVISVGSEGTTAGDNKLDGMTIERNIIYGPLYYDPTTQGSTSTHSIFFGYNRDATIRYNTVIGGGYGIVLKHGGTAWTGTGSVYYNKIINSVGVGSDPIRIKGVKNVPLYNNTIYTSPSFTNDYYSIYITENGAGETSTGTVMKNNIVVGGNARSLIGIESASLTGTTSDNNLFYQYTNGNVATDVTTVTTYNLAQWQALGNDTSSTASDPQFRDAATYDFRLTGTSSGAINRGVAIAGLIADFAGTSLPIGNAPDIGVYEFLTVTTPSSLAQFRSDGATTIATGDSTNESTVVLKFTVGSNNPTDVLTPKIEVQPTGVAFTDVANFTGTSVAYNGTPVTASVTATGLSNQAYHWQALVSNLAGDSTWVQFTDPSFIINYTAPVASSGGSALPPVAYDLPTGTLGVDINNGAATTSSGSVTLRLSAGTNVTMMAISKTPDFSDGAVQESFKTTKAWNLCLTANPCTGTHSVYVKYYTSYGQSSAVVSDSIIIGTTGSSTPTGMITQYLYAGSKHPQVLLLQQKLKALGFFPENIAFVQNFGPITVKSVKAFQLAQGVATTTDAGYGYVGPKTRAKLNSM